MQTTIVFALFCEAFIGGVSSAHGEIFRQKSDTFVFFVPYMDCIVCGADKMGKVRFRDKCKKISATDCGADNEDLSAYSQIRR